MYCWWSNWLCNEKDLLADKVLETTLGTSIFSLAADFLLIRRRANVLSESNVTPDSMPTNTSHLCLYPGDRNKEWPSNSYRKLSVNFWIPVSAASLLSEFSSDYWYIGFNYKIVRSILHITHYFLGLWSQTIRLPS